MLRVAGGRFVEGCAAGTGDLALQRDLFVGEVHAVPAAPFKTTFRFHRCTAIGASFSVKAFTRKQRPSDGDTNISYRPSDARRRGGR